MHTLKQSWTHPVKYDAIVGTGGPGLLTAKQDKDLGGAYSAAVEVSHELPSHPNASGEALNAFGARYPKGVAQDLSATSVQTIPETKRRMLGILPPKIPFRDKIRVGLQDTHPDKFEFHVGTSGKSDESVRKALALVLSHYESNLSPIAKSLLQTNMARRKSPEEYMARMKQEPEEFMPGLRKQANEELSFDWAKSGSWEQYEQELTKVLSIAKKAAAMPNALPMPSTGDYGPSASAPVAPTPPPTTQPGFLDQAKTFGSDLMNQASEQWGKLPTWGQGALIGGGIGALGGLMTDKRKGRGLLQGALLGGGLGALGGYAYNQFNKPPTDLSAIGKAPSAAGEPGTQEGWFAKNISNPVGSMAGTVADTAKSIWNNTPTGLAIAGGGYVAGGALSHLGNREARTYLGPESPSAGKLPVDYMRPTNNMSLKHLQRTKGAMMPVMDQLARAKTPSQGYQPNITTPDEAAAAMRAITRPQRVAGSPAMPAGNVSHNLISGGNAFSATNKDLIREHLAQLESSAGTKLHSPWRGVRNNLMYGGGKAFQAITLATGAAQALGMGGSAGAPVSQLAANMPLNEQTIPIIEKAFRGSPPEAVRQFIANADWLPEEKDRWIQLGWGQ